MLHICTRYQRNAQYAQGMFVQEKYGWHNSAINPSFQRECDHLLHRHLACLLHLITLTYVIVHTQNPFHVYIHQ